MEKGDAELVQKPDQPEKKFVCSLHPERRWPFRICLLLGLSLIVTLTVFIVLELTTVPPQEIMGRVCEFSVYSPQLYRGGGKGSQSRRFLLFPIYKVEDSRAKHAIWLVHLFDLDSRGWVKMGALVREEEVKRDRRDKRDKRDKIKNQRKGEDTPPRRSPSPDSLGANAEKENENETRFIEHETTEQIRAASCFLVRPRFGSSQLCSIFLATATPQTIKGGSQSQLDFVSCSPFFPTSKPEVETAETAEIAAQTELGQEKASEQEPDGSWIFSCSVRLSPRGPLPKRKALALLLPRFRDLWTPTSKESAFQFSLS